MYSLHNFKLGHSIIAGFFKLKLFQNYKFFETRFEILFVWMNEQLTLNLLTNTIVAPPSNASKWQMGFNSAFKGLNECGGRILLGDDAGGGALMLLPIRTQNVGI